MPCPYTAAHLGGALLPAPEPEPEPEELEEPEPEPSRRSSLATSLAFSSLSPSIVSCAVISFCRDASTIFHAFSASRFRDATT